jgi:hypothetical protein
MNLQQQLPNLQARMQQLRGARDSSVGLHQPAQKYGQRTPIERPTMSQPNFQPGPTEFQPVFDQFNQQMSMNNQLNNQANEVKHQMMFNNFSGQVNQQVQQAQNNQSPAVPAQNQALSNALGRMVPPPQDQQPGAGEGMSSFIQNALQEGFDHNTIFQFISGRMGLQAPGAGRVKNPVQPNKQ